MVLLLLVVDRPAFNLHLTTSKRTNQLKKKIRRESINKNKIKTKKHTHQMYAHRVFADKYTNGTNVRIFLFIYYLRKEDTKTSREKN